MFVTLPGKRKLVNQNKPDALINRVTRRDTHSIERVSDIGSPIGEVTSGNTQISGTRSWCAPRFLTALRA